MISLPVVNFALVFLLVFLFFFIITSGVYIYFEDRRKKDEAIIWEEYLLLISELKLSERLLLNVFPKQVAERLLKNPKNFTEHCKNVSVLFADIVGFTGFAEETSSQKLVELLNTIFSTFDSLSDKLNVEKIKTIGDAYMVAAGLPSTNTNHAEALAEMALSMRTFIEEFASKNGLNLKIRVGINTGEVVAGVIGSKKFIYDLWGDTVNTASRMESHSLPNQIQVTQSTYELLNTTYDFEPRGRIRVKGKGLVQTYLLLNKKDSLQPEK